MEFEESPSYSTSTSTKSFHVNPPNAAPLLTNLSSQSPSPNFKNYKKRNAGRKKFRETRHPVYKGVRERNSKWVCELRHPQNKSRIWLGTFSCPEMAARAHDVAALALRGDSASLNFPQQASLLPKARSSSIDDIQIAANEAALGSPVLGVEKVLEGCGQIFMDEEELFNMPGLLDSMAEGLMLTPLAMQKGFSWDDLEDKVDLSLWCD